MFSHQIPYSCLYLKSQPAKKRPNERTVNICMYLTEEESRKLQTFHDRQISCSKQSQFQLLYREVFYTNKGKALVFVSMLSRRNICSWTSESSSPPYQAERRNGQEQIIPISWDGKRNER
ncbi:hypothetical protein ILYODFUR_033018 [Ilyodon furcidens]|uniref:Uncharacterized protein n=1 Tax=Ilyodon furcidens TaxID=33524 RepID=A0ABV0SUP8_9TELE